MRRFTGLIGLVCLGLLAAFPSGAKADTLVDWTLSGNFSDGGTLAGTFTYDNTTGVITTWNVATSAGSVLSAFTYNTGDSTAAFVPSGGVEPGDLDFASGVSPIRDLEIAVAGLSATGGTATIFTGAAGCPGPGTFGGCSDELLTTATVGSDQCSGATSKQIRCLNTGALLTGTVEGSNTGGGGTTGVPEPATLPMLAIGLGVLVGLASWRRGFSLVS